MPGKIYLLQDNGDLQPLTEHAYDNEDLLQRLVGDYPDLLAGDQIDETAPRRWLHISREAGIPIEEGGADHMAVDHIFLDQDAVPTLVEVKRSSDTRIRREVVGQMLDYASHVVAYRSDKELRIRFEASCETNEAQDAAQMISELIGCEPADSAAIDAFWDRVNTNLQIGKLRLIFLADEIPPELRRVVEFLNRFMDPVEVLAVEVHQYVGKGLKTLVPRVIGQSEQARGRRESGPRQQRQWDEPSFFEDLESKQGAAAVSAARAILDWAKANMLSVYWGRGLQSGSFTVRLDYNNIEHSLITVYTYGNILVLFQYMERTPAFRDEGKRLEMLRRLNEIRGITLSKASITRQPAVPISALRDEAALKQFLAVLDWFVQEVRAS